MYFLYGLPGKQWARDFICVQKTATGPFVWYGVIALFFIITFLILEEEMAPIIKVSDPPCAIHACTCSD
jgi:hypothetical protein